MRWITLACVAIVGLFASSASAEIIIQYDTEGIGPGAPTAPFVLAINPAAGVTGINVTRGAGLTAVSASFSLNASGWNDLAADDYYEFGFSTTKPYRMDELTVGLRSSNTGPGFMNLLYSKDGGAFMELVSTNPIKLMGTQFNNLIADLSEIGVVSSSLVLRLVVDPDNPTNALFNVNPSVNSEIGSAGTFRFASYSPLGGVFLNPQITGTLVPEPSSALLAVIGVLGLSAASLWRRRSLAA